MFLYCQSQARLKPKRCLVGFILWRLGWLLIFCLFCCIWYIFFFTRSSYRNHHSSWSLVISQLCKQMSAMYHSWDHKYFYGKQQFQLNVKNEKILVFKLDWTCPYVVICQKIPPNVSGFFPGGAMENKLTSYEILKSSKLT
jgi:hypothetical protein